MTLRDVYRCTLDPKRIEKKIAEVEASVEPPGRVRIAMAELASHGGELAAGAWKPVGGGAVATSDEPALREQLTKIGVAFDAERPAPADPARRERLEAVRRWDVQDWQALDQKLRSSIIEGLSVFLSVFDLPEVASVFCPPAPPAAPPPPDEAPAESAVDVVRPLPPLDEVIDSGRVLCLNMPAGTNPALSSAVGVLLKQAWLTGSPGGGTGSLSASKSFSEHHEPLFHPRDFALLGNCQAIVLPYDGRRALGARRCYLKPDFLPPGRPYWRAREAGEL